MTKTVRCALSSLAISLAFLAAAPLAAQTDYQWQSTTSGGLWTMPGNWLPTGPASGSANAADFSALILPASNTVHLNAPETIGSLIFGDQGNTFNWTLDNNGSASNILTLAGAASITVDNDTATVSAVLAGNAGLTVYTGSLLSGNAGQVFNFNSPVNIALPGTLVLNPAAVESYSGGTTVNGGTLLLDFSNLATPTNLISSSSALALEGGALAVKDQASAAATLQSFNGATLNAGFSGIAVSANGSTSALGTLSLGAITANTGSTVNFTLPTVGSITTSTGNTSGILGGWATVGTTDWAVNSAPSGSGNIAALSTYQNDDFSASTNNVSVTTNDSPSAPFTINSLRFNAPGSSAGLTLTLSSSGSATSTINSGGILVTPRVGVNGATISNYNASLAGGGAGATLIVNQYNTNGALNLTADLASPVVKNGPGTLNIVGGESSVGSMAGSYVNQGTLAFEVESLPEGVNTGPTTWLTFTGSAAVQFYYPGDPGIIPVSASLPRDGIVANAGATGTFDNLLSSNFGNNGGSDDYLLGVGFNSNNANGSGTKLNGAGSFAFSNSFGDSLFAAFYLTNRIADTYTGSTTVYGGQVVAVYGGPDNFQKFSPTAPFYLGGSLVIQPPTTGAATETIGSSLTLIANSASLVPVIATTSLAGATINLNGASGGVINRGSGSTVAFAQFDGTVSLHVGAVATPGGILGGWATYGITGAYGALDGTEYYPAVTDWATVNGAGNIIALPAGSYTNDTWASGNNTTVTMSFAPASGSTTNSLRFVSSTTSSPVSQTITLSGANTIATGGILVTANFTASSGTITAGSGASAFTITGGSLTSGNGQDLIVNDFNNYSSPLAGQGSTLTIASQITGSIGLTASGTSQATAGDGGIVVLANPNQNNNYTGPTSIDGATVLRIGTAAGQQIPTTSAVVMSGVAMLDLDGNNQSVGSLASISYGTKITSSTSGSTTLTVGNDNTNTTFNGYLANGNGSVALNKAGSGTLTLGFVQNYFSGTFPVSSYSGGTTISDGTLSIMGDTSLGSTSGSLTINGTLLAPSILQATGTFNSNRTVNLGPTSGSGQGVLDVTGIYTLTLGGAVGNSGASGTGTLVKIDSGTLALTNNGNTYSGGTIITAGIVNISSDGTLGATTANPNITFNGGAANGATLQFATGYSGNSLATGRNIAVLAGDSGTIDTNGNNITWGGTLTTATSGAFSKVGAGTFEIDAPSSLGGSSALAVSGGALRLNYGAGVSIGNGVNVTVSSGATVELAGSASQLSQSVNIGNAGTLLDSSGTKQIVGAVTGAGNTVVNAGGSLQAYQIRQNSLTIGSGATVTLAASGSGSTSAPAGPNNINFSSSVNSLSIAGTLGAWTGTLDIGNNGLVIAYGTAANDPYSTIDNMIESGYNGGVWGGKGITSTLAQAGVAQNISTPLNIGLLDFTPGTGNYTNQSFLVFEGQTVTTNAILVRLTYMDDIVLAGDMSQNNATSDALLFAANYGSGTTWSVGDLTHDGQIDSNDALLFAANFTTGLPSLDGTTGNAVALGGEAAAVPEPASICLAVLGGFGLALLVRRRRKLPPCRW